MYHHHVLSGTINALCCSLAGPEAYPIYESALLVDIVIMSPEVITFKRMDIVLMEK